MTMPNTGWGGVPTGQQGPPRDAQGYVHLPSGYPPANGQVPQGAPNLPPGMQLQEGMSPLQGLPPVQPQQAQPPQGQPQPVPPAQPQQYQPQQPQPPLQQVAPADLNARLSGANLPQELQGRSVGELVGMLNGLRSIHLQSLTQPSPVAAPPAQPNGQQPPAAPVPQTPGDFNWKNPRAEFTDIVKKELGAFRQEMVPIFQPVLQQGALAAAQNARATVAAEIPNFGQLEPHVLNRLQGMTHEQLGDPNVWRVAARVAIGDMFLSQGQRPNPAYVPTPQYNGVQQVGPGQQPIPNVNGIGNFYSEQPNQGGPGPQAGAPLTQQQRAYATAMGMSDADYSAWMIGVRR